MFFVPSMLRIFLDAEGVERCSSLRDVICGGEILPLDLVTRFHARSAATLHNLYGPTETAIECDTWTCPRQSDYLGRTHRTARWPTRSATSSTGICSRYRLASQENCIWVGFKWGADIITGQS